MSEGMFADKNLHEPEPRTPLTFRLTAEEYRELRLRLGACAFNDVQPIMVALDSQVTSQLKEPAYLKDIPADTALTLRASYGEYQRVLGLIGMLPYIRVAQVIHGLASQAEGQLHGASHLETSTPTRTQ